MGCRRLVMPALVRLAGRLAVGGQWVCSASFEMSTTSPYAGLLSIFDELGIVSDDKLEAFLRLSRESGYWQESYADLYAEKQVETPDRLAHSLCAGLNGLAAELDSLYGLSGIQQFSITSATRLDEEMLKKGLFLSRVMTIFSPQGFSYVNTGYSSDAGDEYHGESWTISHDFVRDLYRHRALIQQSALILLPSAIQYSPHWGGYHTGKSLEILQELDNVKVIDIGLDPELLDRLIARYRARHQLVRLPELHVPWIEHVDLAAVLKIRDDSHDELADFQSAYHAALLEYIEHHRSADFAAISKAIADDIIDPALRRIKKRYKRTLSLHRSLTAVGAAIAVLPVGAAAISGVFFDDLSLSELVPAIPPSLTGVLGAVATNVVQKRHVARALDDERFYVLWRLGAGQARGVGP